MRVALRGRLARLAGGLFLALLSWERTLTDAGAAPSSSGGFGQTVAIEVPRFRGLEPRLSLVYSSDSRSGFAGVGWGLAGLSTVSRTRLGRGTPRFDGSDVFVLDGQELVPCVAGLVSPTCTSGGNFATKHESYLRIRFDAASDSWSVWAKDGTETVLTPVYTTTSGTLRWGQTLTRDTHGNSVSTTWACEGGDCYANAVSYGPYAVRFFREARPDVMSFAIGVDTALGRTRYRLRSVLVSRGGTPIRAYALEYETSPSTARSLLLSVRQFGRDVVIDASGRISGGTALPARVFRYQQDPAPRSLRDWPSGSGF